MPDISYPPGWNSIVIAAKDAGGATREVSQIKAVLSDQTNFYIFAANGSGTIAVGVAAKHVPAKGEVDNATVTIQGKSLDGTDMAPLIIPISLTGPPPDPQATHFLLVSVNNSSNPPADPGLAEVILFP